MKPTAEHEKQEKRPVPRSILAQRAIWATGFGMRTKFIASVMFDALGTEDWAVWPGVRSLRRKCSCQFNTVRRHLALLVDCGVIARGPDTLLDPGAAEFPSLRRKRKGGSRYAPATTHTYIVNYDRLLELGKVAQSLWEDAGTEEWEWEWTPLRVREFVEAARVAVDEAA